MSQTPRTLQERFYHTLLPAIHRLRDHEQGEPLRALLAILEHEFEALRDDTQGLYDDWFIETCSEWVVPYIGDLLGVELQRSLDARVFTQRGYVANSLRYRRRKGTAAVLEQLARDVTGWPCRAVEYFERLATTQHMQHVRLSAPATASLRRASDLELQGGPFSRLCHSVEVRSVDKAQGRFNIPNVGLHLWRLRHYPLTRVEARPFEDASVDPGRYHFDVLGRSGPLFNVPRAETDIVHLAEERDVPARLRRRPLHHEVQQVINGGGSPADGWFGIDPVLRVTRVDGGSESEIAPPQLRICTLVLEPDESSNDWPRPDSPGMVFVDPESGRLAFPPPSVEAPPSAVLVDYAYGFSADLGGGPYERFETVSDRFERPSDVLGDVHQGISKEHPALGSEVVHSDFNSAIEAWNVDALSAWASGQRLERTLSVMDSRSYVAELTRAVGRPIVIPPRCRLRLVAARWPAEYDPTSGNEVRHQGRLDPSDVRPHLRGDIEVLGLPDEGGGGSLELDGLLIEGSLRVLPGELGALVLRHTTLVQGRGGLVIESTEPLSASPAVAPFDDTSMRALATNASLEVELERSLIAGVSVAGSLGKMIVRDSLLDEQAESLTPNFVTIQPLSETPLLAVLGVAGADLAVIGPRLSVLPDIVIGWTATGEYGSLLAPLTNVEVRTSTLLSAVAARELDGSESLFVASVEVRVVQSGCLRYCYAPHDARVPRRFRCQPDLAVAAARTAAIDAGRQFTEQDAATVRARLRPVFTSVTPGHAAYGQLTRSTHAAIRQGAENGGEMGAFHLLEQPHRESNLRAALAKHLRFGLEAGLFFVT